MKILKAPKRLEEKVESQDRSFRDIYYVEAESKEQMFDPLAICPRIRRGHVEWYTTSPSLPGVALKVKNIELMPHFVAENETPELIYLDTYDYRKITLHRITLQIYENSVRQQLAGKPIFESLNELKRYFLETNFQAY